MKYKIAFIQALVVLIPTYIVAYSTEKMVYTIPMLAACSFIAAAMQGSPTKRTDEEASAHMKEVDSAVKSDYDMPDGSA